MIITQQYNSKLKLVKKISHIHSYTTMSQPTTSTGAVSLLDGRVAIITGSSGGIGRAIVAHLASLGARVVINYASSSGPADLLASELNAVHSSPRAVAVQADVSDPDAVRTLFDHAEEVFGCPPHILVTCAGVFDTKYPTLAETTVEDFDRTFAINCRGTFLCCREAARRLSRGGGGRIVTISSAPARFLIPRYGAYSASHAAVEAMTRILAKELMGTGITANCVAPGPVATEMFFAGKTEKAVEAARSLAGRLGETKDISAVVTFLVTDEAEWVNGQVIGVNGGFV
ncbi:NADPH-dependent aldehyde reductase-like protein, chloroplastic [Canna indica]|uniref:NADPH-dependent aldehyde reductase-like protein, chloroplastic n=1 Tax=Canna indica TaxID=4628 RepID=A0AAQ3QJQ4_9LILI|nr:NADPH-dependent aldehyde reductase-like protein, chloroplastic [Canna indica]